ncbi:MAG: GYD domain-containing protein [Deltaproteobacteria bacterium]|nr:GYD domain-containing protein [Deltaproteobacteria bacterium]
MPTYVLMTRLSPELMQDPRGRKAVGRQWQRRMDRACPEVKWLAHYALLGPYDCMDIYEAPSNDVAYKVSLISRACGAASAESWPATPYERYLELVAEIEQKR